jgi:hypothetical protein
MRSYAVRLPDGTLGPEFSSSAEASRWGFERLADGDVHRSVDLEIVMLREGEQVGGLTSHRRCRCEECAPPVE